MTKPTKDRPAPKGRLMSQKDIEQEYGILRRLVLDYAKTGRGSFPSPQKIIGRIYWFRRDVIHRFLMGQAAAARVSATRAATSHCRATSSRWASARRCAKSAGESVMASSAAVSMSGVPQGIEEGRAGVGPGIASPGSLAHWHDKMSESFRRAAARPWLSVPKPEQCTCRRCAVSGDPRSDGE